MAKSVNESLLLDASFAVNWPVPDYQLLETAELSTKALAQRGHLHASGHIPRQGNEVRLQGQPGQSDSPPSAHRVAIGILDCNSWKRKVNNLKSNGADLGPAEEPVQGPTPQSRFSQLPHADSLAIRPRRSSRWSVTHEL